MAMKAGRSREGSGQGGTLGVEPNASSNSAEHRDRLCRLGITAWQLLVAGRSDRAIVCERKRGIAVGQVFADLSVRVGDVVLDGVVDQVGV
jgi:hypothetical protein